MLNTGPMFLDKLGHLRVGPSALHQHQIKPPEPHNRRNHPGMFARCLTCFDDSAAEQILRPFNSPLQIRHGKRQMINPNYILGEFHIHICFFLV